MVFTILNLFFQALIIVLLIRYFIERYRFYGFGPILVAIITLTEKLIKPMKQILPRGALHLQDSTPLVAIGLIVLIRGFALWLLTLDYSTPILDMHRESATGFTLVHATGISVAMLVQLLAVSFIFALFASVMISRSGITTCASAGFTCFQERTFAVFQGMRRIYPTNNLVILFLIASALSLIVASFLVSLASFTLMYGMEMLLIFWVHSLFGILETLVMLYGLILLVTIIASWLQVDRLSLMVQLIRSLADPYLKFFRRIFPWARVDFFDLSPIFAFLFLNPFLTYILFSIKVALLESL